MKMTFRWYGSDDDPIPLQYISQIPGVTGIMGAMDRFPAGQVWPEADIAAYVDEVHRAGLECEVIESVNVHEDIKLGRDTRDTYIANYCRTLENSQFSLPGWEPERLAQLDEVMEAYSSIDVDRMREHYAYFLRGVVPTAERVGIRLAVHPDDPAWPLFGLPRVCHSMADLDAIVEMVDSPANSLCVCTGSLGSDPANDVPAILTRFGDKGRVAAAHCRNVRHLGHRHFQEAAHLSADGSLDMYAIMRAIHDHAPDAYIRPDHGRMIWGETGRPGYPLYDRALGITYLNGLWEAIDKATR
ncbi:mannonate dehydratase [Acidipropionibacterium acidipropionici]|uniref:mannonate dehydratase n=1 Tax=Acidipropionibacterium acidipropionici TaxID=1748 RepID=UPI00110ABBBD|nr:mannonate dehydratase [Acidipropionibacterium acidipropionici]QCV96247.1 mannonate dehydratase [Acidipropionibacterium acidipropionici]